MAANFADGELMGGTGLKQWSAPETRIQLTYSEKCDVWSAGCILYYLISGNELEPNQSGEEKLATVLHDITNCDYEDIPTLIDFVSMVMNVDPNERFDSI